MKVVKKCGIFLLTFCLMFGKSISKVEASQDSFIALDNIYNNIFSIVPAEETMELNFQNINLTIESLQKFVGSCNATNEEKKIKAEDLLYKIKNFKNLYIDFKGKRDSGFFVINARIVDDALLNLKKLIISLMDNIKTFLEGNN